MRQILNTKAVFFGGLGLGIGYIKYEEYTDSLSASGYMESSTTDSKFGFSFGLQGGYKYNYKDIFHIGIAYMYLSAPDLPEKKTGREACATTGAIICKETQIERSISTQGFYLTVDVPFE